MNQQTPTPSWIALDDMPKMPRASYPGHRHAELGVDHGNLQWHPAEPPAYWGPWIEPTVPPEYLNT